MKNIFSKTKLFTSPNPNLMVQCNLLLIRIGPFQCNLLLIYGGRFRDFLAYFPSISHLFLHYFPKNFPFPNYFSVISHLFHSYFSFLNNFPLISQLFLISRRCFSFLSYTSQLFLSYFSTISQ